MAKQARIEAGRQTRRAWFYRNRTLPDMPWRPCDEREYRRHVGAHGVPGQADELGLLDYAYARQGYEGWVFMCVEV